MTRLTSARAGVVVPFVLVALIWGSTWVVIKDQIAVVAPQWTIVWRFVLASAAMCALAWLRGEASVARLDPVPGEASAPQPEPPAEPSVADRAARIQACIGRCQAAFDGCMNSANGQPPNLAACQEQSAACREACA